MKYSVLAYTLLLLTACTKETGSSKDVHVATHQDSVSYSLGMDVGATMRTLNTEIEPEVFHRGFLDTYSEGETKLSDEQKRRVLVTLRKEVRGRQLELRKKQGKQNLTAGEAFLAENAKKEGIVVLPSGLQYRVISAGSGPKPQKTDRVTVHYRGTLLDGTVFDSSYERGKPATFAVTGVIKGWTEALQLMSVGSKWELFIPPDLAYGERGAGVKIEPNSTLIFEVELLSIE